MHGGGLHGGGRRVGAVGVWARCTSSSAKVTQPVGNGISDSIENETPVDALHPVLKYRSFSKNEVHFFIWREPKLGRRKYRISMKNEVHFFIWREPKLGRHASLPTEQNHKTALKNLRLKKEPAARVQLELAGWRPRAALF